MLEKFVERQIKLNDANIIIKGFNDLIITARRLQEILEIFKDFQQISLDLSVEIFRDETHAVSFPNLHRLNIEGMAVDVIGVESLMVAPKINHLSLDLTDCDINENVDAEDWGQAMPLILHFSNSLKYLIVNKFMKWTPRELTLSNISEEYDESLMEFLKNRLKGLEVLSIKQSMAHHVNNFIAKNASNVKKIFVDSEFFVSLDEDIVMPAVEKVYCNGIEQGRADFTEANQRHFPNVL